MTSGPLDLRTPDDARRFYDRVYEPGAQPGAATYEGREEWERAVVDAFIERWCGGGARVLEIGCGHAPYQHRIDRYTGIDITAHCAAFVARPYAVASAVALPFRDASFEGLLTLHTLEHVHAPDRALAEIARILAPGGAALLLPSWYVRSWAAGGLRVRAYAELGPRDRLRKLLLPLLDAPAVRALHVMPRRILRACGYAMRRGPAAFAWKRVTPNYEQFLDSDSDACGWIDPFDVMLFFLSRGFSLPQLPTWRQRFLFRTGALVIRKNGAPDGASRKGA